jgi:hypothetical protein
MRSSIAVLGFTLALVFFGSVVRTPASPQAPRRQTAAGESDDVLPALLVEVRGLRAAIEQMASAGPRVHLALGRVQLQEQRVNALVRRLEESRGVAVAAQAQHDNEVEAIQSIDNAIGNSTPGIPTPGGPSIEMLRRQQAVHRRQLADAAATLRRANAEEAAIATDLANEQARWTDLNQRMEALEAKLGPR